MEPKLFCDLDLEPKINNFGSATLVFALARKKALNNEILDLTPCCSSLSLYSFCMLRYLTEQLQVFRQNLKLNNFVKCLIYLHGHYK